MKFGFACKLYVIHRASGADSEDRSKVKKKVLEVARGKEREMKIIHGVDFRRNIEEMR